MTSDQAIVGIFLAGAGGLAGWLASECTKENIRERAITPKATDAVIIAAGILGFALLPGYFKFFFGGMAAIGFGRLLIQFESGELESEGAQCPLKFRSKLLTGLLWLPVPP